MKRKIIAAGLILTTTFLNACNKDADNVIDNQESQQIESIVIEEPVIEEEVSLQGFIQGDVKAYRDGSDEGFFLQDLELAEDEGHYFSYSIGEMVDLDNDGEDELIINGPYGGMYLDCVDDRVVVFAEGDGTASNLSYVYYDNAYWIVYSDTTHGGRIVYMLTKYNGSQTVEDSFKLCAEFYDTEYENGDFYYRDEAITKEEFESLCKEILARNDKENLPMAYQEILNRCQEIINKVENEKVAYPEEEEDLMGFTDSVLHSGTNKEDFCCSYVDLNDDGIMELILANRCLDESNGKAKYEAGYSLINIFTLDGEEAIPIVEANLYSEWYINDDRELINMHQANPASYEIGVYTFADDGISFDEKYCLYNAYLENNKDVGQFERVNGGQEVLLEQYDDFNNDDLWNHYMDVFHQYTDNPLELDLISICGE